MLLGLLKLWFFCVHWIAEFEAVVVVGIVAFEAFFVDEVAIVLAKDAVVSFVAQIFSV